MIDNNQFRKEQIEANQKVMSDQTFYIINWMFLVTGSMAALYFMYIMLTSPMTNEFSLSDGLVILTTIVSLSLLIIGLNNIMDHHKRKKSYEEWKKRQKKRLMKKV
jgi:hypothetical protein